MQKSRVINFSHIYKENNHTTNYRTSIVSELLITFSSYVPNGQNYPGIGRSNSIPSID
ncbi:hypothetical protein LINPERPRIM_LOCUS17792 [Linum perenne]